MARLTMLLVAFLCLASSASAALSPRKDPSALERSVQQALVRQEPHPPAGKTELVITDKTVMRLDGRVCKYEDVPEGATVILLEVAADKKTVLTIHFRRGK